MSRRRPKTQFSDSFGEKRVRVVCTDQGQHPEVSFGWVTAFPDGHVHITALNNFRGDEYVDLAEFDEAPVPERIHKTYPLKCRRCGRDVPLRAETVERACAGLAASDTPRLDISRLPN